MAMMGVPAKLTTRHHHMAYMVAAGKKNKEIALTLGYTESRVSIIRSSPLFQQLVVQLQREIADRTIDDIVEGIIAEGPASLARMRQLREQDDNLSVAYNATAFLLDKNPKVAGIKAAAEAGVRIALDATAMARMEQAVAEDEGKVVPALAVAIPDHLGVKSLDDAIADATD